MSETLSAKIRQERGTHAVRRMRREGFVPAVLYGHGQDTVHLALAADQVRQLIQHGSKLVDFKGDLAESALIREVQWDTFGAEVLHVDFTRVIAGELVEIKVAIVLRGEAVGSRAGGIIEHILHEVEIECPVSSLPDRLELNINTLEVGQSLHASDLPLPEGAKLLTDPERMVVHCVLPEAAPEEVPAVIEAGEPEVIGRKAEDEEEEGEG
jgi:large subunit ribosomal protein L25